MWQTGVRVGGGRRGELEGKKGDTRFTLLFSSVFFDLKAS